MIRSGKTLLRRPNREDAFREYQRPQWRRKQRNAEVADNAQLPEDDDGDEEVLNEPEEPDEQNAVAPSPLIERAAPHWMPGSAEKALPARQMGPHSARRLYRHEGDSAEPLLCAKKRSDSRYHFATILG